MDVGTAKLAAGRAPRRPAPPARRPRRHRDRLGRGLPAGRAGGRSRSCGPPGARRCWSAAPGSTCRRWWTSWSSPAPTPALRARAGGRAGRRRPGGAARPARRRRSRRRGGGAAEQRPADRAGAGGRRADRPPVPGPAARPAARRATTPCCSAWTGRRGRARRAGRPAGSTRMFAAGLVDETRALLDRGLREGRTASRALGYQQVVAALDGAGDLDDGARPTPSRHPAVRPPAAVVVPPRPPRRTGSTPRPRTWSTRALS